MGGWGEEAGRGEAEVQGMYTNAIWSGGLANEGGFCLGSGLGVWSV